MLLLGTSSTVQSAALSPVTYYRYIGELLASMMRDLTARRSDTQPYVSRRTGKFEISR